MYKLRPKPSNPMAISIIWQEMMNGWGSCSIVSQKVSYCWTNALLCATSAEAFKITNMVVRVNATSIHVIRLAPLFFKRNCLLRQLNNFECGTLLSPFEFSILQLGIGKKRLIIKGKKESYKKNEELNQSTKA